MRKAASKNTFDEKLSIKHLVEAIHEIFLGPIVIPGQQIQHGQQNDHVEQAEAALGTHHLVSF